MGSSREEIAASFDLRAPGYRESDWHRRSAQRLIDLCRLKPGDRLLDLGTGTGFAALHAAKQVGAGGHVLGVDISEGMLREARRDAAGAGLTNVVFVRQDATSLPDLADGSFDVVTCATSLLYIPIVEGLGEARRVLRTGGVMAFSTIRSGCPLAGRLFRERAAGYGVAIPDPCEPLGSEGACRRALSAAGFDEIDVVIETIDFSPRDLERAWESNLHAPSHHDVRRLPADALGGLEREYREALAAQAQADPSALLRSEMLYGLARRSHSAGVRKGDR
jgi:ubiquinone/menaquinone biosynthesis C-methylase UbiE